MSVISVEEIYPGRGGTIEDRTTDIRMFRVITDSGTDTRVEIEKSGMVPLRGHPHNIESNLTCKRVTFQHDTSVKSPRHWIVKAEYDNQPLGALPANRAIDPNPLLRPVEISGHSIMVKRARRTGALIFTGEEAEWNGGIGKSIPTALSILENTARSPFEGLDRDVPIWVVDVTINAEQVQDWVAQFQGCINKDPVQIRGYSKPFPRWSLRLNDWSHSELLQEKLPSGVIVSYYKTRFGLWYFRELWVTQIANRGFYELKNGLQIPIRDSHGARKSVPSLLDRAGKAIHANSSEQPPIHRWYADGPEVDYSVFNLSL